MYLCVKRKVKLSLTRVFPTTKLGTLGGDYTARDTGVVTTGLGTLWVVTTGIGTLGW